MIQEKIVPCDYRTIFGHTNSGQVKVCYSDVYPWIRIPTVVEITAYVVFALAGLFYFFIFENPFTAIFRGRICLHFTLSIVNDNLDQWWPTFFITVQN